MLKVHFILRLRWLEYSHADKTILFLCMWSGICIMCQSSLMRSVLWSSHITLVFCNNCCMTLSLIARALWRYSISMYSHIRQLSSAGIWGNSYILCSFNIGGRTYILRYYITFEGNLTYCPPGSCPMSVYPLVRRKNESYVTFGGNRRWICISWFFHCDRGNNFMMIKLLHGLPYVRGSEQCANDL